MIEIYFYLHASVEKKRKPSDLSLSTVKRQTHTQTLKNNPMEDKNKRNHIYDYCNPCHEPMWEQCRYQIRRVKSRSMPKTRTKSSC